MHRDDPRIRRVRDLIDAGAQLATSDLPGAIGAFLDARAELVTLGLMEAAAAVLMDAVSAARRNQDRALAMRLCRRASRDDPHWGDPLSTLALVETEQANALVQANEITKARILYGRAARHHGRAAQLLQSTNPEAAAIERKFEAFVKARRKAVAGWPRRP